MSLKRYRLIIVCFLAAAVIALCAACYFNIYLKIPSQLKLFVNKEEYFKFGIPIEGEIHSEAISAVGEKRTNIPRGELNLNFNSGFSVIADKTGEYEMEARLFGLFKLKTINVSVIDKLEVIPGGSSLGLIVETKGIMVLGTGKVVDSNGYSIEPSKNKLLSGDYIEAVNNISVREKEKLVEEIQRLSGQSISLKVRRNNTVIDVAVNPIRANDGNYKIGAWIRDDTQGIGTVTYLTTTGGFGALGHGITDVDTGLLIEVGNGNAYTAEIVSITKGITGTPGELSGIIHKDNEYIIGNIFTNTNQGIFGKLMVDYKMACERLKIKNDYFTEIALRQDIRMGKATILSSVSGELEEYSIEIEKIDNNNNNHSKGMVIHITDKKLMDITGGIVQGMFTSYNGNNTRKPSKIKGLRCSSPISLTKKRLVFCAKYN